jgi:hypothetical protein
MTDYDTRIPVTAEGRDLARESKRDGETWDEYIRRCADEPPEVTELVNASELVDAIAAEADGQGRVDDSELAREVARQLDYGELANAVADELEQRRSTF